MQLVMTRMGHTLVIVMVAVVFKVDRWLEYIAILRIVLIFLQFCSMFSTTKKSHICLMEEGNCDDGEVSCCSTRVGRPWSYYQLVCQDFSRCRRKSLAPYGNIPIYGGSAQYGIWQILSGTFRQVSLNIRRAGVKLCKFHPLLHLQYSRWLPGGATIRPLQHPSWL